MNEHTHIEDLTDRIKPRTASNVLLWVVVGFFVVFVIWAALTELDRTVRGQGRVIATSQLQVVSNLEGGVVEAISVRTGQQVKAGQELVRLDRTATGAELGSGEASANALGMKIARLSAEVAGREPAYPAPADQAAASQLMIERSLHASRMQELGSLVSAGQARVAQASRAVQEAQAAYDARVTARDARRQELNLIRPMVERGIEPRLSLMQAESAYAVAASEAAAAAAAISRARSAVVEAQSSLNQQRQDWRSVAANELATAQAEYSARRAPLPALAERSARTVVRAPLPGRVNRVLVTTVGGAVGPGRAAGRDRPFRGDPAGRDPGAPAGHRLGADGPEGEGQHHRLRPVHLRLARRSRLRHLARRDRQREDRRELLHGAGADDEERARSATAGRCRSAPAWSPTSACSATSAPSSITSSARSPSSAKPLSANR